MPASYIGFVQFGAGEGCPCGNGDRRIRYYKLHHGFNLDAANQGLITTGSKLWMTMTGSDWQDQSPPASQDHSGLNGAVTIGRLTGLASREWAAPSTATYNGVGDDFISWEVDESTVYTARVDFADEYTPAMLVSDLEDITDNVDLSILYVPWGETWLAGRCEVRDEWIGSVFDIGSAPADGRMVMQWDADDPGVIFDGTFRRISVFTQVWKGVHAQRDRFQANFMGYFSLQRTDRVEYTGAPADETVGAKRYHYIESGTFDMWGPEPDSAFMTLLASTDYRVTSWEHLVIGEHPPEGETATEWVGLSGLGGGC